MSTKYYCDICNSEFEHNQLISIEINDGEHPHNGSEMTQDIDCCLRCIRDMNLRCYQELDDIKAKRILESNQ